MRDSESELFRSIKLTQEDRLLAKIFGKMTRRCLNDSIALHIMMKRACQKSSNRKLLTCVTEKLSLFVVVGVFKKEEKSCARHYGVFDFLIAGELTPVQGVRQLRKISLVGPLNNHTTSYVDVRGVRVYRRENMKEKIRRDLNSLCDSGHLIVKELRCNTIPHLVKSEELLNAIRSCLEHDKLDVVFQRTQDSPKLLPVSRVTIRLGQQRWRDSKSWQRLQRTQLCPISRVISHTHTITQVPLWNTCLKIIYGLMRRIQHYIRVFEDNGICGWYSIDVSH